MQKIKILICDDEAKKIDILKHCLKEDLYNFDIVNNVKQLSEKLSIDNSYEAVFLDLYYKDFEEDTTPISYDDVINIKRKLKKVCKLFIYTEFTNKQTSLLIQLYSDLIITDWIDFNDLSRDISAPGAIAKIESKLGSRKEFRDGLWFLHLSDIHFGRTFSFINNAVDESLPGLIRQQLISSQSESSRLGIKIPNLCIVSGDSTNTATFSEFRGVNQFYSDLENILIQNGSAAPPFIIAPGNHDFNWRLSIVDEQDAKFNIDNCKVELIKNDPVDEFNNIKWLPFINSFSNKLNHSDASGSNTDWWYYDLSSRFNIRVFVINSSVKFTYNNNNTTLSSKLILDIEKKLDLLDKKFGILTIHHPINLLLKDDIKTEFLRMIYDRLNIRLILSGHKHENNIINHRIESSKNIIEIQTGSISSKPDELGRFQLPHYRILKLIRDSEENWSNIHSWTFCYNRGSFIPTPIDSTGELFEIEKLDKI